ncbi:MULTISPECIES: O-methyltransferase [Staphylococcus]|uniref:tRNA 5-hydroxyuridine methyltransferase n=1 Tax=Staphylococcus hsinchuensis TaxID=3051183 RepID=A0ABZ3EBN7_9STAP|nr:MULTISPECIES: O-methyltransferase [unclassified Staphylococcus]
MDKNHLYVLSLLEHNNVDIESLRPYAERHKVPIVDKVSLEMIKQTIRLHKPIHILEIGTAIGYSAMQFASVDRNIQVTTIERDESMINLARTNFKQFGYEQQINLIEGNALEQFESVEDKQFDMIFIDAAKAQSLKFFQLFTPLLKTGGVVITDNVLYHGFVSDIDVVRTRNVRQMVKKVQQYNEWLMQQPNFNTNFLNIDDGLAISIKGESK